MKCCSIKGKGEGPCRQAPAEEGCAQPQPRPTMFSCLYMQVVREGSRRVLGLRPFDVQLIGGMILHDGQIAEMRTGEVRGWPVAKWACSQGFAPMADTAGIQKTVV